VSFFPHISDDRTKTYAHSIGREDQPYTFVAIVELYTPKIAVKYVSEHIKSPTRNIILRLSLSFLYSDPRR
jgi:hypothetical protein